MGYSSYQSGPATHLTPLYQDHLLWYLLQELDASAKAVGSAAAQVVSLQVMEAVVSEFSLVTASALGLSWEFHENCRNQLEVSGEAQQQSCRYSKVAHECGLRQFPCTILHMWRS